MSLLDPFALFHMLDIEEIENSKRPNKFYVLWPNFAPWQILPARANWFLFGVWCRSILCLFRGVFKSINQSEAKRCPSYLKTVFPFLAVFFIYEVISKYRLFGRPSALCFIEIRTFSFKTSNTVKFHSVIYEAWIYKPEELFRPSGHSVLKIRKFERSTSNMKYSSIVEETRIYKSTKFSSGCAKSWFLRAS